MNVVVLDLSSDDVATRLTRVELDRCFEECLLASGCLGIFDNDVSNAVSVCGLLELVITDKWRREL
jgi:hypothetical protein